MRSEALVAAIITAAVVISLGATHGAPSIERARANDNREPAGALRDGVLTLNIDARLGDWHPDNDSGPGVAVPAFAESGRPPQIPGPLIRVSAGTTIVLALRNQLASDTLVAWRKLAKDGADLPSSRQVVGVARHEISIGETFDIELTPDTVGDMRLDMRIGGRTVYGPILGVLPIRVVR